MCKLCNDWPRDMRYHLSLIHPDVYAEHVAAGNALNKRRHAEINHAYENNLDAQAVEDKYDKFSKELAKQFSDKVIA